MKDGYITKAAAIAAIGKHQCNYLNSCYEQDCLAIANLPAAEVAPVIHGKWIRKRTVEHDGEWYCSICGKDMLWTWGAWLRTSRFLSQLRCENGW